MNPSTINELARCIVLAMQVGDYANPEFHSQLLSSNTAECIESLIYRETRYVRGCECCDPHNGWYYTVSTIVANWPRDEHKILTLLAEEFA